MKVSLIGHDMALKADRSRAMRSEPRLAHDMALVHRAGHQRKVVRLTQTNQSMPNPTNHVIEPYVKTTDFADSFSSPDHFCLRLSHENP
jgi:hypothetical protein